MLCSFPDDFDFVFLQAQAVAGQRALADAGDQVGGCGQAEGVSQGAVELGAFLLEELLAEATFLLQHFGGFFAVDRVNAHHLRVRGEKFPRIGVGVAHWWQAVAVASGKPDIPREQLRRQVDGMATAMNLPSRQIQEFDSSAAKVAIFDTWLQ